MRWKIKTDAATEPVTTAEAKAQLNIPTGVTDWDDLIDAKVKSARMFVEKTLGQCLIEQTLTVVLDEWPCDWVELPRGPVISITHVKYTDAAGTVQTWANTDYTTDTVSRTPRIAPKLGKSWPVNADTIGSIEIEYKAGFGTTADAVPQNFREAIRVLAAHEFEHREDTVHTLPTRVLTHLNGFANNEF